LCSGPSADNHSAGFRAEGKRFVSVSRKLARERLIDWKAAQIEHHDPRLAWGVGGDEPVVGLSEQGRRGNFVHLFDKPGKPFALIFDVDDRIEEYRAAARSGKA
jgi:hypothetical protein